MGSERIQNPPLGCRLARGAFWSLSGAMISRGLGLASSIIAGRLLHPQGFGELGIIQSTIALFGTVAGFGLGMSNTKYLAEFRSTDPPRAGRMLAMTSVSAWICSSIMSGVLVVSAPWVASAMLAAPDLGALLRLGAVLLLFNGVNGAQTGALSGFEAFKAIAGINFIGGLVTFPATVIGVTWWGVKGAVCAQIASMAVICLLNWKAVRAQARANGIVVSYRSCMREWRTVFHFNLPGVLNSLMLSFSSWACGALLVQQAGGFSGLGVYQAVKRIQQVPEALVAMVVCPFLPVLSEAFARKDMRTYGRTLTIAFLTGLLIIVPFSLLQLGAPWVTLLPYGERFHGGEDIVRWTVVGSMAYAFFSPLGTVLISMGRMWLAFCLILLNTIALLGFAWLLIPAYGPKGCSAATSCALILSNVPSVIFMYHKLGDVMRPLRWGVMFWVACALGAVCWYSGASGTQALALALAALCGCGFAVWRIASIRSEVAQAALGK